MDVQDLVSKWVTGVSVVPHTDEVAGSVVDTLLQIAANPDLRPSIPADVWLWLNERPSLPPTCRGLSSGSDGGIVRTVRGLDNIGVLTSYLIMIWSEWKLLDYNDFIEMWVSVREDFNGIGVGRYRAELIQRSGYILGELYRRSRRLDVDLEDGELWREKVGPSSRVMKGRYREFKRMLEEVDQKATEILNRKPHSFILFSLLTFIMDLHRITLHVHVCPASPMSITLHIGRLMLFEIDRCLFTFRIIVVSTRSSHRFGTVTILSR